MTGIDNAIIIEGERFDWEAMRDEIDRNNLWEHRPEYAAAISGPGCCSCPRCHAHYWAEGIRQRCPKCLAEYETDWWPMLSWGVQRAQVLANPSHPMHKFYKGRECSETERRRTRSAVFRWGLEHPDCSLDTRPVFKGTDWIAVWNDGAEYVKEGTMIGGKVLGIVRGPENTLLNIEDDHPSGGGNRHDVCAVRCIEHSVVKIAVGDSVWWQAGKVYWTSKAYRRTPEADQWRDFPLEKVGYSH